MLGPMACQKTLFNVIAEKRHGADRRDRNQRGEHRVSRASPALHPAATIAAVIAYDLRDRPEGRCTMAAPQPVVAFLERVLTPPPAAESPPRSPLKMSFTRTPAAVTPATATSAINATSSAYREGPVRLHHAKTSRRSVQAASFRFSLVCVPPKRLAMPEISQRPYHAEMCCRAESRSSVSVERGLAACVPSATCTP